MFTNMKESTPMSKDAINLSAQMELVRLLEQEITNCLFIPIIKPDNEKLFLVVALINKEEGLSFDLVDIQAVQLCFQ